MSAERDEQITVYRPHQRHELGLLRTWAVMARNVWRSRELAWQLFRRDFLGAYKKSFIGVTWVFLAPLFGIASWLLLYMLGRLRPGQTAAGIPYPAFLLVGTTMWGLFMGFFNAARSTLSAGQSLVMQVNYPHEVLLFQQTARQVANFVIALAFNFALLLVLGVVPSWRTVFLPLVLLPMFLLAAAVGLFFSTFSVVAVDLTRVVGQGMALLMFLSPIIYTEQGLESVEDPRLREAMLTIVRYNPLTHLVCSARDLILEGRLYDNAGFAVCALVSVLAFMLSWRLFFVSEHQIVEKMI